MNVCLTTEDGAIFLQDFLKQGLYSLGKKIEERALLLTRLQYFEGVDYRLGTPSMIPSQILVWPPFVCVEENRAHSQWLLNCSWQCLAGLGTAPHSKREVVETTLGGIFRASKRYGESKSRCQ